MSLDHRLRRLAARMQVSRVCNITGLNTIGVPVVTVVRPLSRNFIVTQGKGLTLEDAHTSGLMEAAESFCTEQLLLPVVMARYRQMPRAETIDPLTLSIKDTGSKVLNARLPWTRAHDLSTNELLWIPFEVVHTDFTLPPPPGSGYFHMSSDGLAAGFTREDALVHAICEIIERNAFRLDLSPRRRGRTAIDPATIDSAEIIGALSAIERAGFRTRIEQIKHTVDVPVVLATIYDDRDSVATISSESGVACRPERDAACLAAILEAVQSRLTRISGARDDLTDEVYAKVRRTAPASPLVEPVERSRNAAVAHAADRMDVLKRALATAGHSQILIVDFDKLRPEAFVVRAVIPGLFGPPAQPLYRLSRIDPCA